jgi:hypothetical protein
MLRILRAIVGVSTYAAPGITGRAFGLKPDENPQASFLGRLFAIRDLALGLGTGMTTKPSRRVWWQLGMLCDAGDAVATIMAARRGELAKPAAVMVTATALTAVGLGAAALAADE